MCKPGARVASEESLSITEGEGGAVDSGVEGGVGKEEYSAHGRESVLV